MLQNASRRSLYPLVTRLPWPAANVPLCQVGAPVKRVCNHPGTGLLAAACGDHVVRMYDVEVRIIGFYTGCAELPFLRRSTAVLDCIA